MAGFASIIGLLLQVMLVVIVARLESSPGGSDAVWQRLPIRRGIRGLDTALAAFSGMLAGTTAPPAGEPLTVAKSDYDAFE